MNEANLRAQMQKACAQGNFKDAYEGFRKLCLDPTTDSRLVGNDLSTAVQCLQRLNRIDDRRNRTILNIDLTTAQGRGTVLRSGDIVNVQAIRASLEGSVRQTGHVYRPRQEQYDPGMRLTDLVGSLDELRPLADTHYVLIRRESGPTRTVSVLSADLAAAFAQPASEANVMLQARDTVHVFDLATSRDAVVTPIVEDLRRQSRRDEPLQFVGVGGRVKVPGQYPLEPGMTVSDLLRAGGSLDQAAYGGTAELARYEVIGGDRRELRPCRDRAHRPRGGPQRARRAGGESRVGRSRRHHRRSRGRPSGQ